MSLAPYVPYVLPGLGNQWRQMGTRTSYPNNATQYASTHTNWRSSPIIQVPSGMVINDPIIAHGNYAPVVPEADGVTPYTMRCAIQGIVQPNFFKRLTYGGAGNYDMTLNPGQALEWDPAYGVSLNGDFYLHTRIIIPTGGTMYWDYIGLTPDTAQSVNENYTSDNDAGASFTASITAAGVMTVSAVASGTIQPGAVIPTTNAGITANTFVKSQTSGTTGGVGVYALNQVQVAAIASTTITTGPADNTTQKSYAYAGTNLGGSTRPLYVKGRLPSTGALGFQGRNAVAVVGDSIMTGLYDTVPSFLYGYPAKGLSNNIPWCQFSTPSRKAVDWQTSAYRVLNAIVSSGCTRAITNLGTNDIGSGSYTLAQVQANLVWFWSQLANRGIPVWQATITPHTSSTDNWATVANQTPSANFAPGAMADLLNQWIRTVPAPLSGYFELQHAVESSLNSWLWTPAYVSTTDGLGLHMTNAGHTVCGSVVAALTANW